MIEPDDIVALDMGEFVFPGDDGLAGQTGVVVAYAIRHRDGVFLFDTGFGFGNAELDAWYRTRPRRIDDALADVGLSRLDITAVANCHLHADHSGQNAAFAGIPIFVQPAEWEIAHTTDHTILEWIDFDGADYRRIAGEHQPVEGFRVVPTPGHTPGHQSLVVATVVGPIILAGQAVYSAAEWAGQLTDREGRSTARDPDAYDRSVARLRGFAASGVRFGHDRATWGR